MATTEWEKLVSRCDLNPFNAASSKRYRSYASGYFKHLSNTFELFFGKVHRIGGGPLLSVNRRYGLLDWLLFPTNIGRDLFNRCMYKLLLTEKMNGGYWGLYIIPAIPLYLLTMVHLAVKAVIAAVITLVASPFVAMVYAYQQSQGRELINKMIHGVGEFVPFAVGDNPAWIGSNRGNWRGEVWIKKMQSSDQDIIFPAVSENNDIHLINFNEGGLYSMLMNKSEKNKAVIDECRERNIGGLRKRSKLLLAALKAAPDKFPNHQESEVRDAVYYVEHGGEKLKEPYSDSLVPTEVSLETLTLFSTVPKEKPDLESVHLLKANNPQNSRNTYLGLCRNYAQANQQTTLFARYTGPYLERVEFREVELKRKNNRLP